MSNTEIAERLQWTKATVGKWRQRFLDRRVPDCTTNCAVAGRARSGAGRIASLLRQTLSRRPKDATHWTVRGAAAVSGTVHRVFRAFAVQPHRTRSFKLSTDPFFVEKVRDIAGLYPSMANWQIDPSAVVYEVLIPLPGCAISVSRSFISDRRMSEIHI